MNTLPMNRLPKEVNSITRSNFYYNYRCDRQICYTINENEETETNIHVRLPELYRPEKSNKIVDENENFVNGFKVVKLENGEYAYVREIDNSLMPYRYDIAFDFNEFGFAMVGRDGNVSWIDKDFRYLNLQGEMVEEKINAIDNNYVLFGGWRSISAFSKGDIPLSRVCVYDKKGVNNINLSSIKLAYFGTDGKLKQFYFYNGKLDPNYPTTIFNNHVSTFDEKGYALDFSGRVLFAKGYYIFYPDLINLFKEKGYMDLFIKDIEKQIDIEKEKILKRRK